MVIAASPVRAPSRMPVADSMYAPLVDVPTSPLKTHETASTSIGFFRSSISAAAPRPTSVPSVSRKLITNSVRRIGRKLRRSTPAMSSLSAIGAIETGIAMTARGAWPCPSRMPAAAITAMPVMMAPRTLRCSSTMMITNPAMPSSTSALRRSPILTGTPGTVELATMPISFRPMKARKSPMPTAKLCFIDGEIELASQVRAPTSVMIRKMTPLTNTAPRRCCQVTPSAARPKAMNAFSPMYGATAMGRFA